MAPRVRDVGAELIFFAAATKNPAHILWNARTLARIIEDEYVDLVHARSRAPAWSALRAARATNRPFVTTYHGAYGETNRFKKLYNSVMARGDIVIANSRYTAQLIEDRYGTEPAKIRVIYRGVDGDEFAPSAIAPDRVEALRDAWGLKPGQRVILQGARLTAWKGQGTVIDAAKLLLDRGELGDCVFILAGDAQGRSGYAQQLHSQVADAGLDDLVRMVGHVSDMPAAFQAAHLAIIASTEPEAFGRTSAEAQALGCPVIATNIGAPPETVLSTARVGAGNETGWLVPPANVEKLADALSQALALDQHDRATMGARARAHVLNCFSLAAMKQQTLSIYDELLGTCLVSGQKTSKQQ